MNHGGVGKVTNPTVVIVVLNYNKKDDLAACLESIQTLEYRPFEVVVVDNASTDGSPAMVRESFPEVQLVESGENLGAVKGRNLGVQYADARYNYEILLFLDDDAEVTPQALTYCVDWLSNHEDTGIVCGKTFTRFPSTTLMSVGIRTNLYTAAIYDMGSGEEDVGQHDESAYVDACGGFAFAIRRDLFQDLEGFDELFHPYGWEEVDLCLRARVLGYRVAYVPRAVFSHKGTRLGRPSNPAYERNKALNLMVLLQRHTTLVQKITCAVWIPSRALKLAWKFVRRGEASMIFTYIRGALRGLRQKSS